MTKDEVKFCLRNYFLQTYNFYQKTAQIKLKCIIFVLKVKITNLTEISYLDSCIIYNKTISPYAIKNEILKIHMNSQPSSFSLSFFYFFSLHFFIDFKIFSGGGRYYG